MQRLATAVCPICGLEVNDLPIHIRADRDMIEIAKVRHPDCETADGIHPRCVEKLQKCTEEGIGCGFFTGADE